MTTPRSYQTEAIITKKTKMGEADRILTLYTLRIGKIQGFAKSVRKTRSKLSGHLELLTHSQVSLARGRNIDTITDSQTIDSFVKLKSDLDLSACALYTVELVNQFTAEQIENEPLFRLLLGTLKRLEEEEVDRELTLRYFELYLLDAVGYRPQVRQCVSCRSPLKEGDNYFCPSAGGIVCLGCRPRHSGCCLISVNAIKMLRYIQENGYENVSRFKVGEALHREVSSVLRGYLKYLLERDVKSAAWLDELRAVARQDTTSLL